MENNRGKQLPKTFHHRIVEFSQSLQIMRDCVLSYEENKFYMIIPIYGQLRSLLAEKSKGNPSLFFEVAKILDYTAEFYIIKNELSKESTEKTIFEFCSPEVSFHKEDKRQVKVGIQEFLDTPVFKLKGIVYSIKDIISSLANQSGGSHYSSKIPQDIAELLTLGNYGFNELRLMGLPKPDVINKLIIRVASVIINHGVELLRKVSEFEYYFNCYIPEQERTDDACLIELFYEGSFIRTGLKLDNRNMLSFYLEDAHGLNIHLRAKSIIEFDRFYLINISFYVTDDLKNRIEISLNGEVFINEVAKLIFSFRNDFEGFILLLNRSNENSDEGLTIGIMHYKLLQLILKPIDKTKFIEDCLLSQKEDSKLTWYKKGSYLIHSEKLEKPNLVGGVKLLSLKEYLKQ